MMWSQELYYHNIGRFGLTKDKHSDVISQERKFYFSDNPGKLLATPGVSAHPGCME
jgi:hypothetical protein